MKRSYKSFISFMILFTMILGMSTPFACAQGATKVVLILGSDSYIASIAQAYGELKDEYPLDLKIISTTNADGSEVREDLKDANIALLEMIGSQGIDVLGPVIKDVGTSSPMYITRSSDFSSEYPNLDYSKDEELKSYFVNGGVENMKRLLLYLAKIGGMEVNESIKTVTMPDRFIYHPDAEKISLDADNFYRTMQEAFQNDPSNIGLITNDVHHTVCQTVYGAVYEENLNLLQELVKENVVDAVYEKDWEDLLASFENSDDFLKTVTDAVYENGDLSKTARTIDAAYHALKSQKSVTADDLYNLIMHQLKGTEDTVRVEKIKQSILKEPTMPGAFQNLKAYKAWYKISNHQKENEPWIGISTYNSAFKNDDIEMYKALLKELEENNANVILSFTDSKREELIKEFYIENNQCNIDVYIAGLGFNFSSAELEKVEKAVELFKTLNIPIITPVYSSDLDDWENNPAGISKELYWQVVLPELEGRIEPIFMGGTKEVGKDPITGAAILKKAPIDYNIKRLSGRVLSWANLRNKENEEKKIALVYYNHDGGKDGIKASYLNVIESAENILEALKQEGYTIDGNTDAKSLEEMIQRQGRNVGSWAPGEMEKLLQEDVLTIPVGEYIKWYEKLPQSLKDAVEKEWGPAPGNVMVVDGKMIIPGMKMGNVFVGPQPMRGWGDDPSKIAHSGTVPPPHQYIAFYFWLQNEFKADAVIHLGTHGTLEWLPGKSVGMGEKDWPDQLIGNMVNINPYIMNNPGEGTQAKRRGYAVIIDHLTPPMIQPELYGDLVELQNLVVSYLDEMKKNNEKRALELQKQIVGMVKANHIDQEINLSLETNFYESAEELHEYLEELATELMPYGLHTLGISPKGDLFDQMVDSIIAYDKSRESDRENIERNLGMASQEILNLICALNGEYIEPGPSRDPIRVPDAMPTGRNFATFDPRQIPDKAAWETGKKAADDLLERYKQETGKYPDSVGVVLWAIETMRTNGESVGMILRLIGTEPVWNTKGNVSAVKITPIEELGRPRVDAVVSISGLFRDTFSNTAEVLDEAFRQVAKLDESHDQNHIKKHYDQIFDQLKEKGVSEEEADALAGARIFGDAPGTYGTGVSTLAETTSAWETQEDLVDTYMNRMSYIYGKGIYGKEAKDVFKEVLKNVDVVTQIRDSLWGTMDNDDVAQYLGGLRLAAKAASGKDIKTFIINTRQAGDPKIQSLSEFIATELRTRILNPKWLEGMLKEGYAGSAEIAKHIGNMFLMDATLDAIDDYQWKNVADTIILDEKIRAQLDPYMIQSIIGWQMEAARRDMWKADEETMKKIADVYIKNAVEYGVVCCHHTCGNVKVNELAASFSTLDQDTMKKFESIFKDATNKDIDIDTSKDQQVPSSSSSSSKDKQKQEEVKKEIKIEDISQVKEEVKDVPKENIKEEIQKQQSPLSTTEPVKQEATPVQKGVAKENIDQSVNTTVVGANQKIEKATGQSSVGNKKEAVKEENQEEAQETAVKAYEIEKKEPKKGGNNGVALPAIGIGLGFVGLVIRGYMRRKKY
ncbi:cobaltochelatase subunit CobN [Marinisporobacter balticus]|uniref:Cobaltochelatase CobN n=1 Tax=Marinisporobacter balticus TaxID=2018667 RepID=A0A4R2KVS2_9FIRM|nr:cobaltochelatase subunit CobN [Marinisporobacter balticus]TCO76927.1 cobaltochelatase CobN [Marinisporobacter balticus]